MKKILMLCLLAGCGTVKDNRTKNELNLRPISELIQSKWPELIGGRPADPKDFPASFYAAMGNARCTATLVGPQVLIIAAHCVDDGAKATITIKGEKISGKCTHGPDYNGNATADYTLCAFDKPIEGIAYELLNQDENLVKVGDEILLTGFGCIRQGGGGGNDGIYRIGEAKVTNIPSGNSNDIITVGNSALCFGDSGGPAFKIVGVLRYQVSINSRGDISKTSYLSAVHTPQAKKFIKSWSDKTGLKICGVHADVKGCRGL